MNLQLVSFKLVSEIPSKSMSVSSIQSIKLLSFVGSFRPLTLCDVILSWLYVDRFVLVLEMIEPSSLAEGDRVEELLLVIKEILSVRTTFTCCSSMKLVESCWVVQLRLDPKSTCSC